MELTAAERRPRRHGRARRGRRRGRPDDRGRRSGRGSLPAPSCSSRSRASSAVSLPRSRCSRHSTPASRSSSSSGKDRGSRARRVVARLEGPRACSPHGRAHRAQPARPALGIATLTARYVEPSREPARRFSTRARRRRACARSRSTPCAAAAGATTAPGSTTRSWSRRTTSASRAGSPPLSMRSASRERVADRGGGRDARRRPRGARRPASSGSCSTT